MPNNPELGQAPVEQTETKEEPNFYQEKQDVKAAFVNPERVWDDDRMSELNTKIRKIAEREFQAESQKEGYEDMAPGELLEYIRAFTRMRNGALEEGARITPVDPKKQDGSDWNRQQEDWAYRQGEISKYDVYVQKLTEIRERKLAE